MQSTKWLLVWLFWGAFSLPLMHGFHWVKCILTTSGTLVYNGISEHTTANKKGLESLYVMILVGGWYDHKWLSYKALKVMVDLLHHFAGAVCNCGKIKHL